MKKRWRKRLKQIVKLGRLALLAGCVAGLAAGCSPSAKEGVSDPAARKTSVPNEPASSRERASAFRFPLIGTGSEREVKERPVIVMVENAPQARPQSGLDQADLVYEVLAEGEITRFLAVYQSKSPQVIGPVRSIRPYFVEIGTGLDALIVHAGWSQDAMDLIAQRKLDHLDEVYGDGAYYWRSTERKMPHNLYTSMEKIRQGAANKKFRTEWNGPQLTFAASPGTAAPSAAAKAGADPARPAQGTETKTANKVTIPYIRGYNVSYQYDAASGKYKRFMEGQAHVDKETGEQLTATNILICESKHQVIDKEGRRQVDVFGPGKGYLVQAGTLQEVTWQEKDGIIRAFSGGKELPLLPGQTWIQIVPEDWGVQTE
ncbi:DUF3048 domain-containing protein [Paenibacillus hamazuiensis]|uniref:DUF3048 domain-containing protein n=1 Tax=Paenibacillus hamazuiensis TaxID=2936508 RepID=UPI00200DB67B|nr:DUF3048 domain-containing protein [Paenibacillus hamazuiensis]